MWLVKIRIDERRNRCIIRCKNKAVLDVVTRHLNNIGSDVGQSNVKIVVNRDIVA